MCGFDGINTLAWAFSFRRYSTLTAKAPPPRSLHGNSNLPESHRELDKPKPSQDTSHLQFPCREGYLCLDREHEGLYHQSSRDWNTQCAYFKVVEAYDYASDV